MQISRRNLIAGGAALAIFGQSRTAQASLVSDNWQGLTEILGKSWHGGGITHSAGTEGGKLTLQLGLSIQANADYTIGGTLSMTSRWDTGTYSARYRIRGYVTNTDEPAIFVVIESATFESGDDLPSNLFWQGLTGNLRLYTESGNSGHWVLSGDLFGTRDGNKFESQFADHPV
ncbi:MAG: hypothetical protein ACKOOL_00915 [Novosphingobium sp.]